ncbi:uncharacterized protein PHACADRAFT_255299 [Phanerochaete carnosa HHB-10118-sp]|uniref:Uncharacterized protein n=1 Tax=Phanerochaete carnosa (strain HHB-10118-sp) TaxID=650164 RepID=K5W7R1_PHACS|nr:uncharacterized protein PHACADRAFT_255299 [Phanerochaete carnosa HHB-10118-sp]EKM55009.1 hypothetical protein PHACADRAFT_255299 [Phanerochaete carnosa HHB-10118-sp]
MANKDGEPMPSPGSDVALPTTKTPDSSFQSSAAEAVRGEAAGEDTEQEHEPPSETPSAAPTEDKSSRTSLDTSVQDRDTSPERTPIATTAPTRLQPPHHTHRDLAEPATSEAAQVDCPDTPCSSSTHSVPDSTAGLDSPMPPSSTAPSSTRTSLTDTAPAAWSLSSKPAGILRSATLPRSASSTSISAVTFAPLPPTEPRRRASHMQLGVAARSRMLRARRMRFVDPETGEAYVRIVDAAVADQLPPHARYVCQGEDVTAAGGAIEGDHPYRAVRCPPRRSGSGGFWSATDGMTTPEEDALPDEDAFVALGKMVKGGAKFLWRKVSKSQKGRDGAAAGEEDASEGEEGVAETDKAHPPQGEPTSTGAPASANAAQDVKEEEREEEEGKKGALRIEFKEPRHCFEVTTSAPLQEVPAEKATPAPARRGAGGKAGRVWEEAVDEDVTKRFEAVARAEKEKERGRGKLVAMLAARTPVKVSKRKESKETLNKQDKSL